MAHDARLLHQKNAFNATWFHEIIFFPLRYLWRRSYSAAYVDAAIGMKCL